jgi:hypothetical protein
LCGAGAGGRRQEAGGRRQEAGGRRQEAGGRRQEAGGRRPNMTASKATFISTAFSTQHVTHEAVAACL